MPAHLHGSFTIVVAAASTVFVMVRSLMASHSGVLPCSLSLLFIVVACGNRKSSCEIASSIAFHSSPHRVASNGIVALGTLGAGDVWSFRNLSIWTRVLNSNIS